MLIEEVMTSQFMIANQGRQKVGFGIKPEFVLNLICVDYPVMRIKTGYNIIFGSLEVFSVNSKSA